MVLFNEFIYLLITTRTKRKCHMTKVVYIFGKNNDDKQKSHVKKHEMYNYVFR